MSRGISVAVEDVRLRLGPGFELRVDALEVAAGQTAAILGPSGAGKSTLLEVLGLLRAPDAGRVVLGGEPASAASRADRQRLAAVFQRPWLFKGSVAANVGYGLAVRGVGGSERRERVECELERVGLAGRGGDSVAVLSGGEAQRVSLARAMAVEPQVLLVDEPLSSLDPLLRRRLTDEFASIVRSTGVTLIWVTHDQEEAQTVADRLVIMDNGRLVADGPVSEVMGLPKDGWVAAFLGVEPATCGRVVDASEGLVHIRSGSADVWVTGDAEPGADVVFSIRPEDVTLFEAGAAVPTSSARNLLCAQIVSIATRGATKHVVLDVDGVRLAAMVSRAAERELGLAEGLEVQAAFKASAVSWKLTGTDCRSAED